MPPRPTIKEVSRLAGVSFKTVSRVLNKEKHVSEETRRRVQEVVDRLNFRPSSAARALAGARSFQIALLYDNPSPHYIYNIQSGAQERCAEAGIRLLLQPCQAESERLVADVLGMIDETHVDGVLLSPPVTEVLPLLDALDERRIRYARIGPGARAHHGLSVSMDDVAAAEELTLHLINLGHRAIGFIGGGENHVSSRLRLQGYQKALAASGIEAEPGLIVAGDYSYESGRRAAETLLAMASPPTAIFAGNDDMAAGALAVAHEKGLDVPGDVSIVGFDDSDLARALWPPLTTVHQPMRELAYQAAGLLIRDDPSEERVTIAHSLVERASSGPAK